MADNNRQKPRVDRNQLRVFVLKKATFQREIERQKKLLKEKFEAIVNAKVEEITEPITEEIENLEPVETDYELDPREVSRSHKRKLETEENHENPAKRFKFLL